MRLLWWLALIPLGVAVAAQARHAPHASLSASSINQASFPDASSKTTGRAAMLKAEVELDRLAISPGVLDGKPGDNARKAIITFQQTRGLEASGMLDQATWDKLAESSSESAIADYTITAADVRGPFVRKIPRDLQGMARLHRLAYRNALELLAEKFHTSEDVLKDLNPGKLFDRAGTVISVPNVANARPDGAVIRIEVDKPAKMVRALGRDGTLVASYPASIGSKEKPAPSGTFAVRRVAHNPDYHYDPKFEFKGVKAHRKLTIAPGPNNPVGLVWIDLTAPSYGIHGTPDPDKIGKTESHGCIRLTNWDALDLARRVRKGVQLVFLGEERSSSRD
jgi:lipoprotein-anchoring transpeptidase ErfK/SrfK